MLVSGDPSHAAGGMRRRVPRSASRQHCWFVQVCLTGRAEQQLSASDPTRPDPALFHISSRLGYAGRRYPAVMSVDELMKIRVGNGLLAGAFVVGTAAAFIGVDVAMFVGAATSAVPGFFQIWFLVIGVLCLAGLVGLAVALVRNPRLIGRTILVTRDAVVMPARRFGVIPVGDVAGVGLVRMRNPRNGAPAGSWAVAVWRSEGSVAYAGGLSVRSGTRSPYREQGGASRRQTA